MAITGILEGTLWLETDHLRDLVISLGLLAGICTVLLILGKRQYVRDLFILYNIFLLFWIAYNVFLMVANLWSRQWGALLHLLDAALIWFFCVFSFGFSTGWSTLNSRIRIRQISIRISVFFSPGRQTR